MTDPITLLNQHIPSLSDEDEKQIENVLRWDHWYDTADLAIRTCHCGKKIDGFYEYVDHLKDIFTRDTNP